MDIQPSQEPQNNKQNNNITKLTHSQYFLLFLIVVVFIACYNMLTPYLNSIILAIILAIVVSPIHNKILKFVKGRKTLAAILS
jgi:predicted PurR-regulated permease PerM